MVAKCPSSISFIFLNTSRTLERRPSVIHDTFVNMLSMGKIIIYSQSYKWSLHCMFIRGCSQKMARKLSIAKKKLHWVHISFGFFSARDYPDATLGEAEAAADRSLLMLSVISCNGLQGVGDRQVAAIKRRYHPPRPTLLPC